MGHLWLNGLSIYGLMGEAVIAKFAKEMLVSSPSTLSTLSDHHMTTGFSPFELLCEISDVDETLPTGTIP